MANNLRISLVDSQHFLCCLYSKENESKAKSLDRFCQAGRSLRHIETPPLSFSSLAIFDVQYFTTCSLPGMSGSISILIVQLKTYGDSMGIAVFFEISWLDFEQIGISVSFGLFRGIARAHGNVGVPPTRSLKAAVELQVPVPNAWICLDGDALLDSAVLLQALWT